MAAKADVVVPGYSNPNPNLLWTGFRIKLSGAT
jgi:hypothetical protein